MASPWWIPLTSDFFKVVHYLVTFFFGEGFFWRTLWWRGLWILNKNMKGPLCIISTSCVITQRVREFLQEKKKKKEWERESLCANMKIILLWIITKYVMNKVYLQNIWIIYTHKIMIIEVIWTKSQFQVNNHVIE